MRFLADENFPAAAADALARNGHDVVQIAKTRPGSPDADVLEWAARESRIILTFDKDFGEIARALPSTCGVILFRIPMPPAGQARDRLAAIIEGRSDWSGNISVVELDRVRIRRLAT